MDQRLNDALDDPEVQAGIEPEIGFARAMHELGALNALLATAEQNERGSSSVSEPAAEHCLVIFRAVAALGTTVFGVRGVLEALSGPLEEQEGERGASTLSTDDITALIRAMEGVGTTFIRGAEHPLSSPHEALGWAAVVSGGLYLRLSPPA